ncbi:hypothetical protein K437DRAFT_259686 [Tilletiaria anomala UBC 951]|uniref:Uncharacterized protein n=1 Tax=Tilletiaria anomala (strain ATCC 24038 / CBS 436.72 / UBC 951) TaxID=1037660 RepID=A0A066V859_TILAU|nr:uncharacterized protein K437DRAFT_259686 [Tilletiaria anomala UBC 951]KDN37676.1 hypothetical protein K437DRAFT_259686 [Tilletiaria anomala UBC 951]
MFFDKLDDLIRIAQTSNTGGKTPVEIRHGQAIVLMVAAIAAFVDPGAIVSFNDGKNKARVSFDHFAFHCYKVGWALAQPRQTGYAYDEITFDLSRILRISTLSLAVHRFIEPLVVHVCRTLSASQWLLSNMLALYSQRPVEMEEWKRILADGFTAQIHQRLWRDRSFQLPNVDNLKLLGPPRPMNGEYRDEGLGGASDRECIGAYRQDVALHLIWKRIIDSELCQPLQLDDGEEELSKKRVEAEAARRDAAAREIYADLEDWALHP